MSDELPRIRRVRPGDEPLTLVISWADGTTATVDLTGVIASFKPFAPLADAELFRQARVIVHGAGIGWPNGLDYSADSLRLISEEQRAMTTEEFRTWQDGLKLSNQETADLLGFSLRTIKNYRAGATISKAVAVTCRSMLRDPTVFSAHFRPRHRGRPRKSA